MPACKCWQLNASRSQSAVGSSEAPSVQHVPALRRALTNGTPADKLGAQAPQLESLTGLEQLTSIQSIDLYGNYQLRDVRALGNASFPSPDTGWMSVNSNPVLPACEVAWLAAHFNYPLEQIGTNNGPEGTCEP